MKKLKLISLNVIGLVAILLLFNFPTFNKVSVDSVQPILMNRDYTETIKEMQDDIETGRMIRSLPPGQRPTIAPLKTLQESYAERGLEYPDAVGEEVPPEYGEPKNGDHSDPVIVQAINAIGNNMTKFMAGLLTLSQILLNFRTFRNRKKDK